MSILYNTKDGNKMKGKKFKEVLKALKLPTANEFTQINLLSVLNRFQNYKGTLLELSYEKI